MNSHDEPGMAPTAKQLEHFRAYCMYGSVKRAAREQNVSDQTLKNTMTGLYARLGVGSAVEAMFALGWITLPDLAYCGWVGRCSRPEGHTGQHGGFRSILVSPRR